MRDLCQHETSLTPHAGPSCKWRLSDRQNSLWMGYGINCLVGLEWSIMQVIVQFGTRIECSVTLTPQIWSLISSVSR